MSDTNQDPIVLRTCIAVTTDRFDRMADFYRVGLGLAPTDDWGEAGGRNYVVDMGTATLEVVDQKQADTIDRLEVGHRVTEQLRFALQVPDLEAAIERLLAHGETMVHPIVLTPWGNRTARFLDPDGIHITLFEAPDANRSEALAE